MAILERIDIENSYNQELLKLYLIAAQDQNDLAHYSFQDKLRYYMYCCSRAKWYYQGNA